MVDKRDVIWLDWARLLGIFLVVFGHVLQRFPAYENVVILKILWDIIYLFHMPLFFLISGYLFKPNQIEGDKLFSFNRKIIHGLIYPYLFYQLLFLPLAVLQHRSEMFHFETWLKFAGGIISGDGYDTTYTNYVCLPCWFIICIIQLKMLFSFIKIDMTTSFLLVLFSVVFLCIRKFNEVDYLFCLDSTIMAIPYFLLGYYMRLNYWVFNCEKWAMKIVIIVLLFTFVVVAYYYNGSAQMLLPGFGDNLFLNYISGISGSVAVFYLSGLLSKWKMSDRMKLISRNTLFIIFFHWLIITLLSGGQVYHVVFSNIQSVLLNLVFISIVSLVILYLSDFFIGKLLLKYPVLLGKSKYG